MAYIKTNWVDRLVERAKTYLSTTNVDGSVTLTDAPGDVYEAGTPLNAENMNKIENQLEALDTGKINKDMIVQNALSTNPDTVASGPALKAVNDSLAKKKIGDATLDVQGNIRDYALSTPAGSITFFTTGVNTTTLPTTDSKWIGTCGLVLNRGSSVVKIILYAKDTSEVAYRHYVAGTWGIWEVK